MSHEPLLECAFFIPIRRDANLSDGDLHSEKALAWLRRELYLQFEGATIAPGFYKGFYKDHDTGRQVTDRSRKYIVAAPLARVDALRVLVGEGMQRFQAKVHLFKRGRRSGIHPRRITWVFLTNILIWMVT